MPTTAWIIIAMVIAMDLLLLPAIFYGVFKLIWAPFAERFPALEPAPDAVHRRRQSIGLDLVNLGWSVDIAADEQHLHLTPVRLFRRLGAAPASVPWGEIRVERLTGRRGGTARVGRWTLRAPEWCLTLAGPGAA